MTFDPGAFDPGAAAAPDSGIFGLPHSRDEARICIVPAPFAATVSYGGGAEAGPAAVLAASRQVDLYDLQFGRIYESGIHLLPTDPWWAKCHEDARVAAQQIIERGGVRAGDPAVAAVDAAGELVNERVEAAVETLLACGKIPGVLGGDHSVPLGAIRACARHYPGMGILHVDAHADLRVAYEGFRYSHASIMHNVLEQCAGVARLVQVGIRDFSEDEWRRSHESGGRVVTHFDADWQRRRFEGETYRDLAHEAIEALPREVYVSFDIDGLDPALCPNTGTPVPGGLSFAEAVHLLVALTKSGRRVVGFDLVEVAPGQDEWDANVGARLLYKLCGAAVAAR
jgi:agmatinase